MSSTRVKCVLIDLSGTLHVEDTEIPGSVEALERLRRAGVGVKFVTNTTKESKRVLHARLRGLGFGIEPSEIFTSLTAASALVQRRNLRPLLLVDDKALEEFEGVEQGETNAVVVGLAPDKFDYTSMNTAFRLVLEGAPLIAVHKARYYRRADGLALGPGPFVTSLEYSTGRKAEVVGKPEAEFFLAAVREFGWDPNQCVMIGDDARDDVGGAQSCGMLGILVKTGKYRAGDETLITPQPAFVARDFSQAVDFVLSSLV